MTNDVRPEIDVLLVEDEPSVQRVMVQVLMQAGYTVHAVGDGTTALQQLGEHRYRAIVCDVALPIMGGIQFVRELESRDPDQAARVLFVTGAVESPDAGAFFEVAKYPVIAKPYELKDLVGMVARLVDRRPAILP